MLKKTILFCLLLINFPLVLYANNSEATLDCLHKQGLFSSNYKTSIDKIRNIINRISPDMTEEEKQYWVYREKVRKEARELLEKSWAISEKIDLEVLAYIRKVMGITDLPSNSRAVFLKRMPTDKEQKKIKEFILKLKIREPEDIPGIKERQAEIAKKLAGLKKMGEKLYENFKVGNQEKTEKYREELVRNELANDYFKLNYQWSRYDILGELTKRSGIVEKRNAYDAPNLNDNMNDGLERLKKYADAHLELPTASAYYGWVRGGGRTTFLRKRLPKAQRNKNEAVHYIRKGAEKGETTALNDLASVDPNKENRLKWLILSEKHDRQNVSQVSFNKSFKKADKKFSKKTKNYDIFKRENFFRDQSLL